MRSPRRSFWRIVKWGAATLVAFVSLAVITTYLWVNRVLPTPHANFVPSRCETVVAAGWERAAERARAQARELVIERDLPGLSAAFAVRGQVVWAEGFGWVDVERAVPVCPNSIFRLASVSKTFTAVTAAKLVEQGRMQWDAPIQQYVPSFPNSDPRISARLLAAHLAGIRDYHSDAEARFTTGFNSATESIRLFASDPLVDTPGRAFHYSTYGFVLLGAVIEGATGVDFPSALRNTLLIPLGLPGIWADSAPDTPRLETRFYERHERGRWVETVPENLSGKWAGGGLLGNASDVARFGSALTESDFLSPQALAELWTPYSHEGPIGYGLGWMIARDTRLRRIRFHLGADDGATAILAVWPDRHASLALLSNRGHATFPFRRLVSLANVLLD